MFSFREHLYPKRERSGMSDSPARMREPSVFGSRTRDRLLLLLTLQGEAHLRDAARTFSVGPSEISKAVVGLERAGLVVSTIVAGARVVRLNRRWFAAIELRALLDRLALAEPELAQTIARKVSDG